MACANCKVFTCSLSVKQLAEHGRRSLRICGDLHFHDFVRIGDRTVLAGIAFFDLIDEFHAACDFAPYGVLTVQKTRIREADEELAVRRIRIHRARHGSRSTNMRFAVEFRRKLLAAAAHACSGGITGLRHETVYDAMEDDTVVEALANKLFNTRDMFWCGVGEHFDDDAAVFQIEIEGVFFVHNQFLLLYNVLIYMMLVKFPFVSVHGG